MKRQRHMPYKTLGGVVVFIMVLDRGDEERSVAPKSSSFPNCYEGDCYLGDPDNIPPHQHTPPA